jgi:FtsP/CotA-like multicopper oxidase with cupredoxin domain
MKVNHMNTIQRGSFKQKPLVAAVLLALATPFAVNLAYANGGGYGTNIDISGRTIDVQTYYANSPQGVRPAYDFVTHALSASATVDTGKPLRKFVDTLGGVYNGLEASVGATGIDSGIPVAIPEKWVDGNGKVSGDDYYEVAIVEYTQQMHSDLPKATRLRGYVQIETPAIAAGLKDITSVVGSEHIKAFYPDGVTPILDAAGNQVYFVHKPHYLGPVIVAAKGTPVRMKYTNYLPYHDAAGNSVGSHNGMGGDLNIPVDRFILGGGPAIDKAGNPIEFPQNRAAIHWHGGDTPWISDGTPHQWTAPAAETRAWDAGIGKGASFQNVPDMPDPGPGSGTLYFPNNLSGRLMMYHDHTSGLTKLNVYLGEAAGYVVYDMTELALVAKTINSGLVDAMGLHMPGGTLGSAVPLLDTVGIPLVIQDKTFVPKNIGPAGSPNVLASDGTVQSQDAKWNLQHWGQPGDLWFPHVYETNQDPNSWDGTNPTGRWDWGPWFWPVFPSQYSLPTGEYGDVTQTPEAFMDTPTVNGQAYPTMTVDPKTYRFRVLSVANDRTLNLSLFQAVDKDGTICSPAALAAASKAAPVAELPAYGYPDAPVACTEVKMVPATPTAGYPATWPTDGRAGGVPDPTTAGPDIVAIGSEGGLLPAPAVIKAQPVSYDVDKRSITILNVLNHGLLLGGGERADVLIDFSKYAGQTLIVYNDAPTPMPAVDPRTDLYTGMGDMTDAGGAYNPAPGYGPNSRTVMQIKVKAPAAAVAATATTPAIPAVVVAAPLDVTALAAAMPAAYAATQPAPIIPQVAYNAPFGTANKDNYAQIRTGGNSLPYFQMQGPAFAAFGVTGLSLISGGSGYLTPPLVTFSAPQTPGVGSVAATAEAILTGGVVTGFNMLTMGSGYTNTSPITVSIAQPPAGAGGTRATATVEVNAFKVINKAIQELFEPVYGRMNATLAAELPFSNALVATTIPLAYIDAPIDYLDGIKDGETQIWKITHNGVDSHPVHFHMINVQVINRVDWAGVVKPPAANELGWKETILMNPLEDIYVAAKAVRPVTPFGLPKSARTLDPTQPVGATMGFTQIDPTTGQTPLFQAQLVNGVTVNVPVNGTYSNQLTDFDNEYVWHCHILGHEENDFMRPMIFHPIVLRPDAPVVASAVLPVTWTDPTPFGGLDINGVPTARSGSSVVNANGTITITEPTNNPKNEIGFKVLRNLTTTVTTTTPAAVVNTVTTTGPTVVALVPANVTSWNGLAIPASTTKTDAVTGVVTTISYAQVVGSATYDVVAYNAAGDSTAVNVAQVAPAGPATQAAPTAAVVGAAAAPTGLKQTYTPAAGGVAAFTTLSWDPVAGATGYTVTGAACTPVTATSCTIAGYASATVSVSATVGGVPSAAATAYNGLAYSPVGLLASNGATGAIQSGSFTLTWANNPLNLNNVTGLTLTWSQGAGAATSQTFPATVTGATIIGLAKDKKYTVTLTAVGAIGNSLPVFFSGPDGNVVLSAP